MNREEHKGAIEVSVIFHEGQRMFAVPKQPAQRPWVGLSEDEIKLMDAGITSNSSFYAGALWAEAKLKEKNNG
jgi:hypothetical protein